jgi:hypothetical protein
MFLLESEGIIAPVTYVYVYLAGLGGKLRDLPSWPARLDALLVL